MDFTQIEKEYIMHLLNMSEDSLRDLETWQEQSLMTWEEIYREYQVIGSIRDKLEGRV